jgi:hypothetical protein
MTLREKFKERLYNQSHDDSECLRIRFENIDKVIDSQERIADEFAIEFAEWYLDLWNRNDKSFDNNSPKKLLEIFKKEKGL